MRSKDRVDSYIKEAAEANGFTEKEAQELIRESFYIMREIMALPGMPGFTVPGWGKYWAGVGFFRSMIIRMIRRYRDGKMTREAIVKVVSEYYPLYKMKWKLQLEEQKKKENARKRNS
jgi:hypothetical protein